MSFLHLPAYIVQIVTCHLHTMFLQCLGLWKKSYVHSHGKDKSLACHTPSARHASQIQKLQEYPSIEVVNNMWIDNDCPYRFFRLVIVFVVVLTGKDFMNADKAKEDKHKKIIHPKCKRCWFGEVVCSILGFYEWILLNLGENFICVVRERKNVVG